MDKMDMIDKNGQNGMDEKLFARVSSVLSKAATL